MAVLALRIDELVAHAGSELGASAWHSVTQEEVDLFARATSDGQWIHVDHERASAGPFGRTIAHGYFTLSLGPALLEEVLRVDGASLVVNYGLNRVRFPAPVPVGSRIRLRVSLGSVEDVEGGVQAVLGLTFELEGRPKPCCVAEAVFRYLA